MESPLTATPQPMASKKGKRWNKLEERRLMKLYQTNMDYAEIAVLMGRTTSSITSRLQRLEYIRYDRATDSLIRLK